MTRRERKPTLQKGLNRDCPHMKLKKEFGHYVCEKRQLSFGSKWEKNPCEGCDPDEEQVRDSSCIGR